MIQKAEHEHQNRLEDQQHHDEEDQEKQKDPDLQEAEERSAPTGKVVYKAILHEGEEELERPSSALFWSGLAAGLSMGFSLVAEGLLKYYLPHAHWAPLVSKFGYSIGFLIVILGRQQLFTENTLTPILPFLQNRKMDVFGNVARLWAVVLLANLAGAFIFAWVIAKTPAFDEGPKAAFVALGHEAVRHGFLTVLVKGIFAGWLIALMVWLLPFAEAARVWVIILITYVVGIGQFSHIIAGSVETFTLAAMGEKSWNTVFLNWVIPTLIGNIVGGVTLVAALNHAQVVAGGQGDDV
ncbi:MAG TPA: formate/nitrite transporter family protein [Tepidisphaeraceae bacterium]|jgi:formate/nitrite transporter FocA (FNT family)